MNSKRLLNRLRPKWGNVFNYLLVSTFSGPTLAQVTAWRHFALIGAIASQITNLTIVNSIVYSDADQRKHRSSASLAFVRGIHREPVNVPHKSSVTRKMFPFDDVIMTHIKITSHHITKGGGTSYIPTYRHMAIFNKFSFNRFLSNFSFVQYFINRSAQLGLTCINVFG